MGAAARAGRWIAALGLALVLAGCSDDSGGHDAGGDGTLFSCKEPGKACNPHDNCAIDPICGEDHICRPQGRQDCDDGLDCTEDDCGGQGLCINTPVAGSCALLVPGEDKACYESGAIHPEDPCRVCDPERDPERWSPLSGGSCDDGDPCTRDDRCEAGTCRGTYFAHTCDDGLSCTQPVCDGVGSCENELQAGKCLIGGACYDDGQLSDDGCDRCDAGDPLQWTAVTPVCQIGAICVSPGAHDTSGCGVCNPALEPAGWSPSPDHCLIGGECYAQGATDSSGCGECQPAASREAFTPVAGKCLIDGVCRDDGATSPSGCGRCDAQAADPRWWVPVAGAQPATSDFEGGLGADFSADPLQDGVGWQAAGLRAHGGQQSLYYGDPAAGSYDNGAANSGAATRATLALPAGQRAALHFWLYLDVESSPSFDVLTVQVNGTPVWVKSAATIPADKLRRWVPIEVDLGAFAGADATIAFAFDTKDGWSNQGQGVFVDDVVVLTECGTL